MTSAATIPHGSVACPDCAGDDPRYRGHQGHREHQRQHGEAQDQHWEAQEQHWENQEQHWENQEHRDLPGYGGDPQPGQSSYPPAYVVPPPGRLTRLMLRAYERAPVWTGPLAVLFCFVGAAGLVIWDNPAASDASSTPTCLVKLTTGFDCPGCGGTRAFWYLMHGNVAAAARYHVIATFAAPFLVYAYIAWVANKVFRRRLPMLRVSPRAVTIFLAAWGIWSVARNLPWAPFTWFFV